MNPALAAMNWKRKNVWPGGDRGDRACVYVHELVHHSRRDTGASLGADSDHGKPAQV